MQFHFHLCDGSQFSIMYKMLIKICRVLVVIIFNLKDCPRESTVILCNRVRAENIRNCLAHAPRTENETHDHGAWSTKHGGEAESMLKNISCPRAYKPDRAGYEEGRTGGWLAGCLVGAR